MSTPHATDALNDRIPVFEADRYPADLVERERSGKTTHVAVVDAAQQGRFLGLLSLKDLMERRRGSELMFGDLAARKQTLRVWPRMPLSEVVDRLVEHAQDAAAVVDEEGKYLGAVTIDEARQRLETHRAEARAAAGAHFRAIFEQAAVGVAQVAPDGRWMDVNARLCAFLGYLREELMATTFQAITHPDDLETDLDHVRRLLAGEVATYAMEKRYRRKDGAYVWGNLTVSLVRDERGEPLYFISVVEDIDARKRAEAGLADAAAQMGLMVKASNIGLWDWDLSTNKVRYSREWKSQLGYREDEISDDFSEWERRVHPGDLAPTLERVRAYLDDPRRAHEAEFRMRHKAGSWRWIYTRGEILRDADGRAVRMLGCHVDITERKGAEERLAASERRFRALVEGADVIVWETDPRTNTFTYVSPQAARLGYPLEEWYSPDFWARHVHPDDRAQAVSYCRAECAAGRSHRQQYRMVAADGRAVWVEDYVTVDRREDGTWTERGVLIDITERRRAADLARIAREREVTAIIAAGVAHEFNSLLYAASLQIQQHAPHGPGPAGVPPAKAMEALREARVLAAALLDLYAGPEKGRAIAHSLYPWLPETVSRLAASLPPGVRVSTEVALDLPEVTAHPLGLEQVVRNLLKNAADAMNGEGNIRVSAERATVEGEAVVEVRVHDDGPGIPEEFRARVFEPGFSTRTRPYRSGLGLAIATRLLEQFGGSIAHEPGTLTGSIFIIRLGARPEDAP